MGVISDGRVSLNLKGGGSLTGTITASSMVLRGSDGYLGDAPMVFSRGNLSDYDADADAQKCCGGY